MTKHQDADLEKREHVHERVEPTDVSYEEDRAPRFEIDDDLFAPAALEGFDDGDFDYEPEGAFLD